MYPLKTKWDHCTRFHLTLQNSGASHLSNTHTYKMRITTRWNYNSSQELNAIVTRNKYGYDLDLDQTGKTVIKAEVNVWNPWSHPEESLSRYSCSNQVTQKGWCAKRSSSCSKQLVTRLSQTPKGKIVFQEPGKQEPGRQCAEPERAGQMEQRNRHKSLLTGRTLTGEAERCSGLWVHWSLSWAESSQPG